MTQHEMYLNTMPFLKIKSRQKNIELRIYDEKRQKIKPGDEIIFTNRNNGEKIITKVTGLCWFEDFASLVLMAGWKECGWDKEYDVNRYNQDMELYYSKQDIKKYGALGIILELMDN